MPNTTSHASIRATAHMTVRTAVRHYLSTSHLRAASHLGSLANKIELEHQDSPWDEALTPYINEHRAYVIGAILTSASFLEASINELFSDAYDHPQKLNGISRNAKAVMSSLWQTEHFNRHAGVLEKFETALEVAGKDNFRKGDAEFQNAKILLELRNALVHFKPEFTATDESQVSKTTSHGRLSRSLRGKFDPSKLGGVDKTGSVFFPQKCLGYGCAAWSVKSSFQFAQLFYEKIGLAAPFEHMQDELGL
jgi:hypothetical protein